MIESPANARVKLLRSLTTRAGRERQRACLVEGIRLIEAAVAAGGRPSLALFDPAAVAENPRLDALLRQLSPEVLWAAVPEIIEHVSETVHSQGVVAAFPIPATPLPTTGITVVADALADPGNVGTLIRTAAAAGASGLAYLPGTVDPFSPKVIRAGAGTHWHLPIARFSVDDLRRRAERGGWLAVAEGGTPFDLVEWRPDGVLVVGSEAHGTRPALAGLGLDPVTIPLSAGVESLNSAVAAAVLLFEVRRRFPPAAPGHRRRG